jgi:hypothetical protein
MERLPDGALGVMMMNAIAVLPAEPVENLAPPPVVYFWGPVRSHVNRVATEYAARLQSEPVWLDVSDPEGGEDPAIEGGPVPSARRFVLRAGKEIRVVPLPPARKTPLLRDDSNPTELDVEVGAVIDVPHVVRTALQTASQSGPHGVFLLSNIDRLRNVSPLFEQGSADTLLRAFRSRGIVLILTSEGLLDMPRMEYECAFEVSSMADEEWWEAEVRPGVPFSCCSDCPGTTEGAYAICEPNFRLVCPIRVPFPEAIP